MRFLLQTFLGVGTLLLFLSLLLMLLIPINGNNILASAPPYITSVVPAQGGTEGGTRITIFGFNFAQNGIFSSYNVFIGGQPCAVIHYYSSDGKIVCLTPKCMASYCQDPTWQGNQNVPLNIYLQTAESILSASTTFKYSGSTTPVLTRMSHYSWGSATSYIQGKLAAAYLDDVAIFIGGSGNVGDSNIATIGEPGELNAELYGNSNYWWGKYDYPIYYRPPLDMAAGAYNLSLVVQDVENLGWGSGSARTFPIQYPLSIGFDFRHRYLYDSTLSGTPYNIILFPAVNTIRPAVGSVGGGTVLTISGSGFSTNVSNNIVYAGGQRCVTISSDFNTITCRTSTVDQESLSSFVSSIQRSTINSGGSNITTANLQWNYNSTRSYGSSGWWVKIWDGNSYASNSFPDSAVRLSFGVRQGMSFGLYYNVGSDWPSQLGYNSKRGDSYVYVADYLTILVAPFTGTYFFYVQNVDDYVSLYGAPYNQTGAGPEKLLVTATYSSIYSNPYIQKVSSGVSLKAGDRYHLRARMVNNLGPDNLHLALRIDPQYFNDTLYLSDGLMQAKLREEAFSPPLTFSDNFLQHHAVRDIQTMRLSMNYQVEIQTITISGFDTVNPGYYAIIIQNDADTSYCAPLTPTSSGRDIANAMSCAVNNYMNPARVECNSFSVATSLKTNSTGAYLQIAVSFLVDNTFPLSFLYADTSSLNAAGSSVLASKVTRTQLHSTIPSGTFVLEYTNPGPVQTTASVDVPFNANSQQMQDIFQTTISPDINVYVSTTQYQYTYTWTITFVNPRGLVPLLQINASDVVADKVVAYVTRVQNGSDTSIMFDPIPAWLTEVPLKSMATYQDLSNVEVYVRSDSGDVLKSICDNSGNAINNELGAIKGSESSCAFNYQANATAIISNFSMYEIDAELTHINIYGSNFLIAGSNKAYVSVTIATHNCNITTLTDKYIACVVSSVAWGYHVPSVMFYGFGLAVLDTTQNLFFPQAVYSISPTVGSFAGGQIVTITGRGLRSNASIYFVGISDTCEVISWKTSEIKCRAPASSTYYTHYPTSYPSCQPSTTPTILPTKQPYTCPTLQPISQPTGDPSVMPISRPTSQPSNFPSADPSSHPSYQPTNSPIFRPTLKPSQQPSDRPTSSPENNPSSFPSRIPSSFPSSHPSIKTTFAPTSIAPTFAPSSEVPTFAPSSEVPTCAPSSEVPTFAPSIPTFAPSSEVPTCAPSSEVPTCAPSSEVPTISPSTLIPTTFPTSEEPTTSPTSLIPTITPSSVSPSMSPSSISPSVEPSTDGPSISPSTLVPSSAPSSIAPSFSPSAQPSFSPSITPTTIRPTNRPSSSFPSIAPFSFAPSFVPSSRIPTRTPSSKGPTNSPSTSPSFIPSATKRPTISPTPSSLVPTIIPSAARSLVPTVSSSTRTPSSLPTNSRVPTTSGPSIEPSIIRTVKPSVIPSTLNPSSRSPSRIPTSVKPSFPSTLTPSVKPSTRTPTAAPSKRPSIKPSTATPVIVASFSRTSAIQSSVNSRRRLLTDNTFPVVVDGFNTSLQYAYDAKYTPIVQDFSPLFLSSGYSVNITFRLRNLFTSLLSTNVSISIGDEVCSQVNKTKLGTVSCVLVRNSSATTVATSFVKIYLEGSGYASSSILNTLPTVSRGFALLSGEPLNGSVLGGNTITINGFGFDVRNPQRHIVQLSEVGLVPYTDYDQLLLSLGFPVYQNRSADQVLNCTVLSLNFTQLRCQLAPHANPYRNNTYLISVKLNNIAATVATNLTYLQSLDYTPTILSDLQIISRSSQGEYVFTVSGTLLNTGTLSVSVDNLLCTVVNITQFASHQKITVMTPPLTAGSWAVLANVSGKGVAQSSAVITVGNHIESVTFESSSGSIGGGTVFKIKGYGFSTDCSANAVTMTTSTAVTVTVSEYLRCSPYEMLVKSPSAVALFSAAIHAGSQAPLQINSVSTNLIVLGGVVATLTFSTSPFAYSLSSTPRTRVDRTSGYGGMRVEAMIRALSDSDNLTFTIGGQKCDHIEHQYLSDAYYNMIVDCTIPNLVASSVSYNILIDLYPYGYAVTNHSSVFELPTYLSLLVVHPIGVISSSVFGGVSLSIAGKGFTDAMSVTICDSQCVLVQPSQISNLTCTTPMRLTMNAVDSLRSLGVISNLIGSITGTFFSSPSLLQGHLSYLNDGNFENYISVNSKTCSVGIQIPAGYRVTPYRMRFYPRLRHSADFSNVWFEGSSDGSTYTSLGSLSFIHEGWNFINAPSNTTAGSWFKYLRLRVADISKMSYCALAEIDFLGVVAAINDSCPIIVSSALTANKVNVGVVKYESLASFTPIIGSVSPDNGTALGGTLVTLTGQNLEPANYLSNIVVTFSGVECSVVSYNSNSIQCITGIRRPENIEVSKITVLIPGRGYAAVNNSASYLYIDNWSALTSWQYQEPPVDGDIVWIPDGQVILLDTNTPILVFLLVEGALYFDRTKDLALDAFYIFVLGGYLEVGTEQEPFEKSAVITLHGDRYKTIEVPPIGSKCLAVANKGVPYSTFSNGIHQTGRYVGQLEIHGQKRLRTWTKVNTTAFAGNNWLITSEPVDFKAGEIVILTGNEVPDCGKYANCYGFEELVVAATYDRTNVTFTTPLAYDHRSEVVEVLGKTIDMRCEIGLLTRNVIIQGSADNSDGQLFGVHTVAMQSGIYRMENAEIRRCGQAFNFGRYCTHSHKAGDMEGSYVKANSIHRSFQRAVTTHDTNNWEVRDNVAFDVKGHAYFVEDGTEEYNSITGNLGVYIKPSSSLLPGDQQPAIFWTATPTNFWRDNVAAHSSARGMWFEFAGSIPLDVGEEPTCPTTRLLGEHRNNTFHSNNQMGMRIYPQWTPVEVECDGGSAPAPQYFYGMNSYRNGGNGLFSKRHGSIHHRGHTLVENGGDEVSIVHYNNVAYDMNPTFEDCLFVGSLDSTFQESNYVGKCGIFGPQDEYFYVKNSTFMNYGQSGVLTGCNECLVGSEMNQGAMTARFEQLQFIKSPARVFWSETKKEILWDLDGTLAGVADSMVTRSYGNVLWSDACSILPYSGYTDSVRCGGNGSDVRVRRMQLENVAPGQLYYTDINIISDAGVGRYYFLPLDTSGWVFPVVSGINRTYALDWPYSGHIQTRTAKLTLGRVQYLTETINNPKYDESVVIRQDLGYSHTFDYEPYSFTVSYAGNTKWATINSTKPLRRIADAHYLNYTFDVMLNNKGAQPSLFSLSTAAKLCPPRGCPVPPVPHPGQPLLWSKKSSWSTNNYQLPTAGQSVTISPAMWIVLDISPPKLANLIIYGKLSFLSNESYPLSLTLSVQSIQLWGTMEILGQDNNSFAGSANVIIYGGKGASRPVTMGEGNFVGSKVISVAGRLAARGRQTITWSKLNRTVTAGTSVLVMSQNVPWAVGDEVVLSPTGFYDESGSTWSTGSARVGPSLETRVIKAITTISTPFRNYSQLTLKSPLNHTHLCETIHGDTFCGAVGLLTRSVQFTSQDSETPKTTSYGFGANIHVVDVFDAVPYRYGSVDLRDVQFTHFGKLNTDHYAVVLSHRDYNHPPSYVLGCSFKFGYNLATRVISSDNFTFSNNVAVGNYGGGVYIEASTINFEVNNNLVLATYQLPSVLFSSYPWVRPVAAFTILSSQGYCVGNVAAGSDDQGFAIATSIFNSRALPASQCEVTMSGAYSYSLATLTVNKRFVDNEAVGCRGGLFVVAVSPSESVASDCAVVSNFKAWRNSHTGILSIDAEANILIANVSLAENHIGISLHFYKEDVNVFTGVVASQIIGSLGLDTSHCSDLTDSLWMRGKHCRAFTASDPFGLQSSCGSVISKLYRRVGILIPQWTNKPKTCAIAGRFDGLACDPPTTPDRLCEMPWEKRYGLPLDVVYAEQHIHDTAFIGFQTYNFNTSMGSGCIPSNTVEYSPAIAINPSQIDMQPTLVTSGLIWDDSNLESRISFGTGSFTGAESGAMVSCLDRPCSGQNMMIIHDNDGTLSNQGVAGQLVWNNPEYTAPFPYCTDISQIYVGLFFCRDNSDPTKAFKQYSAVWRDWGPQVIQPIITTRHFAGEQINRSFASYGPIDDMCAKRMYFSRFPMLISNGSTHRIMSTGTTPSEFLLRWDAPSSSHVAILKIFFQQSYDINVLVSNDPYDNFQPVQKFYNRYPNLADPAGSNTRDPQSRIVVVVLRGGANRFYRFRQVPTVAVTMKLDLPFETFVGSTFIANMALLLGISRSRIKIASVRRGSTVIDFETSPNVTVAANKSSVAAQIADLKSITSSINTVITNGALEQTIAPILTCVAAVSHMDILAPYNNLVNYPVNSTLNSTKLRVEAVAAATPVTEPSLKPSTLKPSSVRPTISPTKKPTIAPRSSSPTFRPSTTAPSRTPTTFPSAKPTSVTSSPTVKPSFKPSSIPTAAPTGQQLCAGLDCTGGFPCVPGTTCSIPDDARDPNKFFCIENRGNNIASPTCVRSGQSCTPGVSSCCNPRAKCLGLTAYGEINICSVNYVGCKYIQPTTYPTFIPSAAKTSLPTRKPSAIPSKKTSLPTIKPTTISPSALPTRKPSAIPSKKTSLPTIKPTTISPSVATTTLPTRKPSAIPSAAKTSLPTIKPTTISPSALPTRKPSAIPSKKTSLPTIKPTTISPSVATTSLPTINPSLAPSVLPTRKPSAIPSAAKTSLPTKKPSFIPSALPTRKPTSFTPTKVTSSPTRKPTVALKKKQNLRMMR
eukprot:gene27890-36744_t